MHCWQSYMDADKDGDVSASEFEMTKQAVITQCIAPGKQKVQLILFATC